MAKKTNPNAGKPGYDKYGVKLMSQRKKEKQAEKNRKQFIESRDARNKKIKDSAAQKAQVEKIKNTMGLSETSPSAPKNSTPKRKKQSVASSITDAKIKKLDTSVKGENIKAKESSASSEPKKQVSNKERRQLNRAANLALRTGKTLDEASALKEKRRTARKQYLRNFASQLARGEQAAPIRGFGEGDGNPANDATLAGASAEVAAKKAETDSFAENILSDFTSIGNDNSDLLSNDIQSLGSFESEDSSPITYMKKEYRKKRGY